MGHGHKPAIVGLDGNLKEITEAALEHILLACPKAEVIERGSKKIVRIPQYDVATDENWWEERQVTTTQRPEI